MAIYLETIKTAADGTSTGELAKYPDEMTAAIFYHSALNTNIRLVQDGTLKSYYANIHNESGVKLKEERWAIEEPEPVDPVEP